MDILEKSGQIHSQVTREQVISKFGKYIQPHLKMHSTLK